MRVRVCFCFCEASWCECVCAVWCVMWLNCPAFFPSSSPRSTARAAAIESWEREALERQLGGGSLPPDDEGDCAFEEGVDIDEATSRAAAAAAAAELEHKKQVREGDTHTHTHTHA